MSDDHNLLLNVSVGASMVGDGGPAMYRQRGKELPEKYLPGRYLQRVSPEIRARLVRAANSTPAEWWVKRVVFCTTP